MSKQLIPDVSVSSAADTGLTTLELSGAGLLVQADFDVEQATVLRDMISDSIEHIRSGGHGVRVPDERTTNG